MKRTLSGMLLALALVACPDDPEENKPDPKVQAAEFVKQGDDHLAKANLAGARDSYNQALGVSPADAHAAMGAAIIDLLLLPDSAPVSELLGACGQPHFDVQNMVFGPDGLLAKDEAIRQGSGNLRVLYRTTPGAAFGDTNFAADHFRATRHTYDSGNELSIRLTDVRLGNGESPATVSLWLNLDDLYSGDDVATPLVDGTIIDLTRLAGSVSVWMDERWSSDYIGGTVLFRGGTQVGAGFTLEFTNLALGACDWMTDSYESRCGGEFQLNGSIADTVSEAPQISESQLPFGTVEDRQGPPHVDELTVAIEQCGSNLSTDLVAGKAKALSAYVDGIVAKLDVALAGGPQSAGFVLPKTLLHSDEDIQLNGTDALALRAMAHAASALLQLGASYRYLDGPLVSLIGEYSYCSGGWGTCDPSGNCTEQLDIGRERGFLASPLAQNLASTFLTRAAGFELAGVRSHLDGFFADAAAALRNRPSSPGILDFQAPRAAAFSNQLADQLEALRSSLTNATPVELARNPLYKVHLKAFFDNPLDRSRLLALSGLTSLFSFTAGDPNAQTCDAFNDRIEVELPESSQEVQTWSGGVLVLPADASSTTCSTDAECPAGYACDSDGIGGYCREPRFMPIDEGPMDSAFDGAWPAFVSPGIHRLMDSWN